MVIDAATASGAWRVAGFTDLDAQPRTEQLAGVERLGDDSAVRGRDDLAAASLILGTACPAARTPAAASWASMRMFRPPSSIQPPRVAASAALGEGTVVMAHAAVNPGASAGRHAIVNTGAIVEHDVVVGDRPHIGPGAVVGGGRVGDDAACRARRPRARPRQHRRRRHGRHGRGGRRTSRPAPPWWASPLARCPVPDRLPLAIVPYRRHDPRRARGPRPWRAPDRARDRRGRPPRAWATDGDLRRVLAAGDTLEHPLAPRMSTRFVSVHAGAGRAAAIDLMRARRINAIPAVDDAGRPVGLHLLHEFLQPLERPNWAVVMRKGQGARLRPLTDLIPKPMLQVAGRPISSASCCISLATGSGASSSVNYLGHMIEDHFGDGAAFGARIEYLRETEPLGTAGSPRSCPRRRPTTCS
ncbi:MAG: sugar phosphate nucleotidyltransferase [Chloroflexota bacterium]